MSVYYMNTPFALAEQGMGSSVWMAQLAMAQATPEAPLGLQGRAETVKQNKQALDLPVIHVPPDPFLQRQWSATGQGPDTQWPRISWLL